MMTMWSVGAIFALIGVTYASNVPVYSDKASKDFLLMMDTGTSFSCGLPENQLNDLPRAQQIQSNPVRASVINPEIEMEFSDDGQPLAQMVSFLPISLPQVEESKQHKICGSFLGIELPETKQVFCNVTFFDVEIHNFSPERENLLLDLLFGSDKSQPFSLSIPVFRVPAEFESGDRQKEFEAWAENNAVGAVAPFSQKQLNVVRQKEPLKMNFNWLKGVLPYGITQNAKREIQLGHTAYFSRPVVLTDDVIQEIFAIRDMFLPPKVNH